MNEIKIHSKVNVNLHPDSLRGGDSQGVKTARLALGVLYVAEGKVRDLYSIVKGKALVQQKAIMMAMPKPAEGKAKVAPALMYDQQAADHVISVGTPLATAALKTADVAITSLTETVSQLDSAINIKLLAGKSNRGEELRSWAAKQELPFQKLGELFQAAHKNAALVSAVLEGESYLSNLSVENRNLLRTVAAGVMAPDEVTARKETFDALEHLTTAAKSFGASMGEVFNSLASPEIGAINSIVKEG